VLSDIVDVAMGNVYSMALESNGTVLAWGANAFGQLGDGTQVRAPLPFGLRYQTCFG
jgi:alpha-tubulin suppressor-like RCC1 family protein